MRNCHGASFTLTIGVFDQIGQFAGESASYVTIPLEVQGWGFGGRVMAAALQALAFLNNGFMTTQARHFAERVEREAGSDLTNQVDLAILLALGRPATAEELAALVPLTEAHGLANTCRAILNLNEFSFVD